MQRRGFRELFSRVGGAEADGRRDGVQIAEPLAYSIGSYWEPERKVVVFVREKQERFSPMCFQHFVPKLGSACQVETISPRMDTP